MSIAPSIHAIRAIAIVSLAVSAAGCASGPSFPRQVDCSMFGQTAVSNPDERFVAQGFSVQAPAGDTWCFARPNRSMVSFTTNRFMGTYVEKKPDREDWGHTFAAAGMAVRLKEQTIESHADLSSFMKQWMERGRGGTQAGGEWYADLSQATRFKNLSFHVAPDPTGESLCVRYEVATEERDNPRFPGWLLLMTGEGIACHHPDAERMILLVEFSERRRYGLENPELSKKLRSEAETTLRSLDILPL